LVNNLEKLQKQLENYEHQESQVKTGLLNAESHFKEQLQALQLHPAFRKFLNSEKRLIQSEKLLCSIENYIRSEKENQNINPVLRNITKEFVKLNNLNKANL
jgi:superoxide dismutase